MLKSPKLIGKVGHDVFPVGDPGHEALVLAVEPVVELAVADPWAPKVVKVIHFYPQSCQLSYAMGRESRPQTVASHDEVLLFVGLSVVFYQCLDSRLDLLVGRVETSMYFTPIITIRVFPFQEVNIREPVFSIPWHSSSEYQSYTNSKQYRLHQAGRSQLCNLECLLWSS
jgi:hypothetical protein